TTGPSATDFNTINLDNSGTLNTNRLPDGTPITISGRRAGAVLKLTGATTPTTETVGAVTVDNGNATISNTFGGTSSSVLTLSSLTLTNGAAVNFSGVGLGVAGPASAARIMINGLAATPFMGPQYFFKSTDFAKYDANGVGAVGSVALAETAWTGQYAKPNATGTITLTGDRSPLSLLISSATTTTIAVGAFNLDIVTGGLLLSNASGTSASHAITGTGRLTAGGSASTADLFITIGDIGNASGYWPTYTIGVPITDNPGTNGIYGDAGDGVVRLVKNGPGTLIINGANTFTGGVLVGSGVLQVGNVTAGVNSIGANSASVTTGATLNFYSDTAAGTRSWSNAITLADGAILGSSGVGNVLGGTAQLNGGVSIPSGVATLSAASSLLRISSAITGSGGVMFTGTRLDSNQSSIQLDVANSYGGGTTFGNGGFVIANNADAFGTAVETILINAPGTSATVPGARAKLTAQVDLNNAKTFEIGPLGTLSIAAGITFDNNVTGSGGTLSFVNAIGSRTVSSNITLTTGTTTTWEQSSTSGSTVNQTGVISGNGSLSIVSPSGAGSNSSSVYFRGVNLYAGGTTVSSNANNTGGRFLINNASSLGSGPIYLNNAAGSNELIRLENSVTLANTIRGAGQINSKPAATTYTLTVTGTVQPGDIGVAANRIAGIGTLDLTNLNFQGNYTWDYDVTNGVTNSDLINASLGLTLNAAPHVLNVNWLGSGSAPAGVYTLFTYASAVPDPLAGTWTVNAPAGLSGVVSVDDVNNKVLLTLDVSVVPEPATLGFLAIGGVLMIGAGFARRRRAGPVDASRK
ncbi:MAG: autotransporter-associated beta strand repeat-containing protein, partial [Phycisphaerae bacterium]|nr:autotransporter-associated beta strand repeat-containing protein [Phycisphaerae bacterium]